MREGLFYDGADTGRKLSAYWVLLLLAAIIATAGVAADSTATVIGAMIVAPLMTPILGAVLAVVTGDGANLLRSLGLAAAGAVCVVAIAWLTGFLYPVDIVSETSSQVSGRVQPRLIDLVAALATGAVGAFAVVRSDVSNTLPGVAIAISLVPPLAVVGLTAEAGESGQSLGALLLFLTNVGAILLSGLVVMALYGVHAAAAREGGSRVNRRLAVATIVVFVAALTVPLTITGLRITTETRDRAAVADVAADWAEAAGWRLVAVETTPDGVEVSASGGLPSPSSDELRRGLDAAGLGDIEIVLDLVPAQRIELPPS